MGHLVAASEFHGQARSGPPESRRLEVQPSIVRYSTPRANHRCFSGRHDPDSRSPRIPSPH